MALTGSDKAYLWARAGLARSGATRSNYVAVLTSIDWIRRDSAGNIIATTDISDVLLVGSLQITQALHEEPDTCSLSIRPGGEAPQVGDEIRISWAPGGFPGTVLFHGYVLVAQQDWHAGNLQPPWRHLQCQDPLWRFDARIVTYRFPAQSVTRSIQFLVQWFCNADPVAAHPLNFDVALVQAGMPSIPAFDVVNQRPSTVLRTLTASVGGGFYLEGLALHAWAQSASEPDQSTPQPLTVDLPTLKAFRLTTDATQVRRRVLVEGRRTETLVSYPDLTHEQSIEIGVALTDASPFVDEGAVRIGTQWMVLDNMVSVTANGRNPPQTQIATTFDPYGATHAVDLQPMPVLPPPYGWVRVGNQYARYGDYVGDPLTGIWSILIAASAYGRFSVPVLAGETVEWVDGAANMLSSGLSWRTPLAEATRAQLTSSPVVVLAMAQAPVSSWPELEGFVQDGRYSVAGAQARAAADLAAFQDPLVSAEWVTEDPNAVPGRLQTIALSSVAVTPAINTTVTITRVNLSFPLRTLPARRQCAGGQLKASTFLDVVVTATS